jgi:hypothetical protein
MGAGGRPAYGDFARRRIYHQVLDDRVQVREGRIELEDACLEPGSVRRAAGGIAIHKVGRVQLVHHAGVAFLPTLFDPTPGDAAQAL